MPFLPEIIWADACRHWCIEPDLNACKAFVAGCLMGMDMLRDMQPDEARQARHDFANDLQVFYGRKAVDARRAEDA